MSISSDGDVIDLVTPPSDTQMLQDIERRSTAFTQEGQTMSKRERDDDDKDSDIVYSMNAKKPSQSDETDGAQKESSKSMVSDFTKKQPAVVNIKDEGDANQVNSDTNNENGDMVLDSAVDSEEDNKVWQNVQEIIKRKRGRPPQVQGIVKRRRGRPPKHQRLHDDQNLGGMNKDIDIDTVDERFKCVFCGFEGTEKTKSNPHSHFCTVYDRRLANLRARNAHNMTQDEVDEANLAVAKRSTTNEMVGSDEQGSNGDDETKLSGAALSLNYGRFKCIHCGIEGIENDVGRHNKDFRHYCAPFAKRVKNSTSRNKYRKGDDSSDDDVSVDDDDKETTEEVEQTDLSSLSWHEQTKRLPRGVRHSTQVVHEGKFQCKDCNIKGYENSNAHLNFHHCLDGIRRSNAKRLNSLRPDKKAKLNSVHKKVEDSTGTSMSAPVRTTRVQYKEWDSESSSSSSSSASMSKSSDGDNDCQLQENEKVSDDDNDKDDDNDTEDNDKGDDEDDDDDDDDDDLCVICRDGDDDDDDKIIYCDGCNVAVHQMCYGVEKIPEGDWYCNVCDAGGDPNLVVCELCDVHGGAYKPTTQAGKWVHVLCALPLPEVFVTNEKKMEPFNLKALNMDRFKLKCCNQSCPIRRGVCLPCSFKDCKKAVHPQCLTDSEMTENWIEEETYAKHEIFCSGHKWMMDKSEEEKKVYLRHDPQRRTGRKHGDVQSKKVVTIINGKQRSSYVCALCNYATVYAKGLSTHLQSVEHALRENTLGIDSIVETKFGHGKVVGVRSIDNILILEHSTWLLANGQPVKMYVRRDNVYLPISHEKVEAAQKAAAEKQGKRGRPPSRGEWGRPGRQRHICPFENMGCYATSYCVDCRVQKGVVKINKSRAQQLAEIDFVDDNAAVKVIFKRIRAGDSRLGGGEVNFWIKPKSTFAKCLEAYCSEMSIDITNCYMVYANSTTLMRVHSTDSPKLLGFCCGNVIGVAWSEDDFVNAIQEYRRQNESRLLNTNGIFTAVNHNILNSSNAGSSITENSFRGDGGENGENKLSIPIKSSKLIKKLILEALFVACNDTIVSMNAEELSMQIYGQVDFNNYVKEVRRALRKLDKLQMVRLNVRREYEITDDGKSFHSTMPTSDLQIFEDDDADDVSDDNITIDVSTNDDENIPAPVVNSPIDGRMRVAFSADEDRNLILLYEELGNNWVSIAEQMKILGMPFRRASSYRGRYINHLRYARNETPFTEEEDARLSELHSSLGNKWEQIGSFMPGRKPIQCMNRWYYLVRNGLASKDEAGKMERTITNNFPSSSDFIQINESDIQIIDITPGDPFNSLGVVEGNDNYYGNGNNNIGFGKGEIQPGIPQSPLKIEIPSPFSDEPSAIAECPCVISTPNITVFSRDYAATPISAYELFRVHEGNRLAREEVSRGNLSFDPTRDETFENRLRTSYKSLDQHVRDEYSSKSSDLNHVICNKMTTLSKPVTALGLYNDMLTNDEDDVKKADWNTLSDEEKNYYTHLEFAKNEEITAEYVNFSDWVKRTCARPLHELEEVINEERAQL